ncbi:hypothetical protein Cni_G24272 [Canna indica]|uniref:Uncharacterized protein n=1 Tax=Canna indica TaxID=4628 RepID=A0AAQ3KVN5_9LILI|nr:hypothetical protein Cni_G24272 [Canna indica]
MGTWLLSFFMIKTKRTNAMSVNNTIFKRSTENGSKLEKREVHFPLLETAYFRLDVSNLHPNELCLMNTKSPDILLESNYPNFSNTMILLKITNVQYQIGKDHRFPCQNRQDDNEKLIMQGSKNQHLPWFMLQVLFALIITA